MLSLLAIVLGFMIMLIGLGFTIFNIDLRGTSRLLDRLVEKNKRALIASVIVIQLLATFLNMWLTLGRLGHDHV